MNRILFVDDEPKILTGLRRSLRRLRGEWEVVFAEGGAAALEQCQLGDFDVVVSDARMPGMEGRVLFEQIMQRYPDTVRIILSGQCSRASAMKCVDVAHQFLNKPCDPTIIEATVKRVCAIRYLFQAEPIRAAVTGIQWLPCQKSVREMLERELTSAKPSTDRVIELIGSDIGLSAKLIQLVSSGFFGTPQHARSPQYAADLLGFETLKELLTTSDAFRMSIDDQDMKRLHQCNRHAFAVATLARQIATSVTDDQTIINNAFLAGFLHELGTVTQIRCQRPAPPDTTPQPLSPPRTIEPAMPRGGLEIGGYLAALWGLPDPVVQAITFHRHPGESQATDVGPLTAVHLANVLLSDQHASFGGPFAELDVDYLRQVGCPERLVDWNEMAGELTLQEVLS